MMLLRAERLERLDRVLLARPPQHEHASDLLHGLSAGAIAQDGGQLVATLAIGPDSLTLMRPCAVSDRSTSTMTASDAPAWPMVTIGSSAWARAFNAARWRDVNGIAILVVR